MWFKNLSLMRLPADFALAAEPFETALAEHPLRSPGPLELETRGFLSPFSRPDAAMAHGSHDALLFCLGSEARMLPSSVVRESMPRESPWRQNGQCMCRPPPRLVVPVRLGRQEHLGDRAGHVLSREGVALQHLRAGSLREEPVADPELPHRDADPGDR